MGYRIDMSVPHWQAIVSCVISSVNYVIPCNWKQMQINEFLLMFKPDIDCIFCLVIITELGLNNQSWFFL